MARSARSTRLLVIAGLAGALIVPAAAAEAAPRSGPSDAGILASSPELTETSRLADRRSLVVGDRAYAMGTGTRSTRPPAGTSVARWVASGHRLSSSSTASGFGVADEWLGDPDGAPATKTTVGWGYTRTAYVGGPGQRRAHRLRPGRHARHAGRADPHVPTAADRPARRRRPLRTHVRPTRGAGPRRTPARSTSRTPGRYDQGALLFRETGHTAGPQRFATRLGRPRAGQPLHRSPSSSAPNHRGPQDPAVVCPADGPAPADCDDSAFGKGTGGQLTLAKSSSSATSRPRCGSPWLARNRASRPPGESSRRRWPTRRPRWRQRGRVARQVAANTQVGPARRPAAGESVAWSKQNLADSVQEARDLQFRTSTKAGRTRPRRARWTRRAGSAPAGPTTRGCSRTDGEYTAFAASRPGSSPRSSSTCGRSATSARSSTAQRQGRPRGDPGRRRVLRHASTPPATPTRRSKFPSAVALHLALDRRRRVPRRDVRLHRPQHAVRLRELDKDSDGWPEGLGNVERSGMGVEKLDSTVYTIRGPARPGRPGGSKGDSATPTWATTTAATWRPRSRRLVVRRGRRFGTPTRSTTRRTRPTTTPRSSSGTGSASRRWRPSWSARPGDPSAGDRRSTASSRWRSARSRATPASSGSSTPGPAPRRPAAATGARPATRRSPRCRASARSSR